MTQTSTLTRASRRFGSLPEAGIDRSVDQGNIVAFLTRPAFGVMSFLLRWMGGLVWRWLLGPVVERLTFTTVQGVTEMVALGVSGRELRRASVDVNSKLGLDDVFEEHFWDVIERSLAYAPFKNVRREEGSYAFLLPAGKMPDPKDRGHFLYGSLKRQGLQDRRLLETALVVDERVREAVGAIGLIHSTYYGDENVIDGAAHFLLTGACSMNSHCARCRGSTAE